MQITPAYTATVISNSEGTGEITLIDGPDYTLTATPNPGYIFDHWEYRESENGDTWDDTDWKSYTGLAAASGNVTIAAHTQFRARFRPVTLSLLEAEAFAYQFTAPTYWVASDKSAWWQDEPPCLFVGTTTNLNGSPADVSWNYHLDNLPLKVGRQAVLSLPILISDGEMAESPAYSYKLYLGDSDEPIIDDHRVRHGIGYGEYDFRDAAFKLSAGETLSLAFFIRSMPDVNKARLEISFTEGGTPRTLSREYALNPIGETAQLEDPIDVYMTVEKLTVGRPPAGHESKAKTPGYVIEPIKFAVERGSNAAQAIENLLAYKKIDMDYTGSSAGSFYLAAVRDADDPSGDGWLREKEYFANDMSGWMYSVNNVFPGVGSADWVLNDGDVIRWQFTARLGDLGVDVNGLGVQGTLANKDALTAKIAEINEKPDKAEWLAEGNNGANYDAAMSALTALDASQDAVNGALAALLAGTQPLRTLSNIAIAANPAKLIYSAGDAFDPAGLAVTGLYSDGSSETMTDYATEPAAGAVLNTPGAVGLTVSCQGKTATLSLVVIEAQAPAVATPAAIVIASPPAKTVYTSGDALDLTGLAVTALYGDGTSAAVTGYAAAPANGATLTTQDAAVTVSYMEKTARFNIAVNEERPPATLVGIAISSYPEKTSYTEGEALDLTGLVVTGLYSDGRAEAITAYETVPQPGAALAAGNTSVMILYAEMGASFTVAVYEAREPLPPAPYEEVLEGALAWIRADASEPAVGSTGGEWAVLALARAGVSDTAWYDKYLADLRAALSDKPAGPVILDPYKPTENERVTLALTALGLDATDFEGYDFVTPLADTDWVNDQGVNSTTFALIALNAKPYSGEQSKLTDDLLALRESGKGWSLTGNSSVDETAMAIQALAPYYGVRSDVTNAIDEALAWLSSVQYADGGFGAAFSGGKSSESTAQVLVALSALGIDAARDSRFQKEGGNPLTALLAYRTAEGGFRHIETGNVNSMATEQAAYALVAYDRYMNDKNSLYDMRDANEAWTTELPVSKAALDALIASAEALNPARYTAASLAVLQGALSAAKTARDTAGATQAEIDGAKDALAAAINALEVTGAAASENSIRVTFRLIGATLASRDVNISNGINDSEYVTWIPTTSYTLYEGALVYDLFMRALADAGLSQIGADKNYVATIYAPSVLGGYKLSEFTNGKYSGWMYTINGSHPGYGLKEQALRDGDRVIWHYVNDYRHEVQDWFDEPDYPALGDGSQWNKWLLAPDRAPTAADAVSLPGGATENEAATASGGGGGAPVATVTVETAPALDANTGKATVKVETESVVKAVEEAVKAVETAKADGKANAVAEIKIAAKAEAAADGSAQTVRSAEADIPAEAIKAVADAKNLILTVESDVSTISFDAAALADLAAEAKSGETVRVTAALIDKAEALNAKQAAVVGENPVVELAVTVGDRAIRDFGGAVTVSAPYAPPAALAAEDRDLLTVYFLDDEGNISEMKGAKYDAKTGLITFTTEHFSKFFISEWISPFADIKKGDWYYKNARYAYASGLINGTDKGFEPQATLTRAMLVTILAREAGADTSTGAGGGTWYAKAVEWGIAEGITDGTDPGGAITREQFAVMLHRYAGSPSAAGGVLAAYADAGDVSAWAEEALNWAVSGGLIAGRAESTLAPAGTATRAEAAALLQRYIEGTAS